MKYLQLEGNYTRIANVLIENGLMKLNLSGYESRIIWMVIRKTYGFHKEEDRISVSQFIKGTSIKRWHVSRTLEKLVDRNILVKNSEGYINTYSLQKDYTKWVYSVRGKGESVTPKGDSSGNVTYEGEGVSPIKVTKLSPIKVTTKEKRKYTKENIVSKEGLTTFLHTLNDLSLKVQEIMSDFLDRVRQGNLTKHIAPSRVERIVQELRSISNSYGEGNLVEAIKRSLAKEDYSWGTRNVTGYVNVIAKNLFEQSRQGEVEEQARVEKEALAGAKGSEFYNEIERSIELKN